MDLGLKDKVALVTGSGSPVGFGRGIAHVLADQGCHIIVNDVDIEGAQKTAAEIEAKGQKALAIQADITDEAAVKAMVEKALAEFGQIDILVNNAGLASKPTPFLETPVSTIEKVMGVNFFGTLNVTRAVLPDMVKRKGGKIINIASGAGLTGMPRNLAYAASKAAIIAITKGLQKELAASKVYVNSIAPGLGDTHFLSSADFPEGEVDRTLGAGVIPSGRTTTPEDIGNMVAYLASEKASNIMGQLMIVDGGMFMR